MDGKELPQTVWGGLPTLLLPGFEISNLFFGLRSAHRIRKHTEGYSREREYEYEGR